ncbi:AAA family ATPase [Halomonas sp. THAF12]|uniref:AAA family ATPase n=1 Tax=Halomonas sp. B23F22_10 TaxID=3459515 RepID=UPI00373EF37D
MKNPTLYIFSGLPGSGKSTLAKNLASDTGAVFIRIDTIEQAVRDLCDFKVEGEGYRLSYRIALDNLALGNSVIADSCNPIELTRQEWRDVAINARSNYIDIEVKCSDVAEHKHRIETREQEVPGLKPTTWQCVIDREFHPWESKRIVIDTAGRSIDESFQELILALNEHENV